MKKKEKERGTYDELRKIGVMGMDFDDVVTKLIEDYKDRHSSR